MLTFYTNPMSRGRIARWMLEELGQPYETVALEYYTTMKAPAYLAVNPMGKVPAVVHDGKVVTEVAAICTYLALTFPEAYALNINVLIATGLILFVVTFAVNALARWIVSRRKEFSGAN